MARSSAEADLEVSPELTPDAGTPSAIPEASETVEANEAEVSSSAERREQRAEQPSPGGRARSQLVAVVAALALVVGLASAVVVLGIGWFTQHQDQRERVEAVEAARQAATNLTSISFQNADRDVARVIDNSVGDFRELFAQNRASYISIVKQGEVLSTGQVTEAALKDIDGNTAHVMLAVQSNVRNKQQPNGETRTYRMVIEMQRQESGAWLAGRVDFIP